MTNHTLRHLCEGGLNNEQFILLTHSQMRASTTHSLPLIVTHISSSSHIAQYYAENSKIFVSGKSRVILKLGCTYYMLEATRTYVCTHTGAYTVHVCT